MLTHTYRINHDRNICWEALQQFGHYSNKWRACKHSSLYCVNTDVIDYRMKLCLNRFCRHFPHTLHSQRILCRDRSKNAHAVNPTREHGFEICLDTGTAAAIRPSNRQNAFHIHTLIHKLSGKVIVAMTAQRNPCTCHGRVTSHTDHANRARRRRRTLLSRECAHKCVVFSPTQNPLKGIHL